MKHCSILQPLMACLHLQSLVSIFAAAGLRSQTGVGSLGHTGRLPRRRRSVAVNIPQEISARNQDRELQHGLCFFDISAKRIKQK